MQDKIMALLGGITHPEAEKDIVSLGIARDVKATDEKINVSLYFARSRDPFAMAIKRKVYDTLREAFPEIIEVECTVAKLAPPLGGKIDKVSVTLIG